MTENKNRNLSGVRWWVLMLLTAGFLIVLLGGSRLYLKNMSNTLWNSLVSNALEITEQGSNALALNLGKDAASVQNITGYLNKFPSSDIVEIKNTILLYTKEPNTEFVVFDLTHNKAYTTAKEETQTITDDQLADLSGYGEQGWVAAFYSPYDGKRYVGYYERFLFSDGAEGVIRKNIDVNELGARYSLFFFNGQGYSYVVDQQGSIIIRSQNKHSNRTLANIFDVISANGSKSNSLSVFEDAIKKQASGIIRIDYSGEPYIIAFDGVDGTNEWSLLSLIPESAINEYSDTIMKASSLFIAVIGFFVITILVFLEYFLNLNKKLSEKESELQDALVVAQSANRAKTTFLNNMSHDIRTPMNAILGFTTLATTHVNDTEAVKEYLGKISKSADHLLSLINDVLDMSRIESGKVHIHEKEENLSEILHALRDIVQADVSAKHMNFFMDTVDVADEYVICDRLRLNQVLLNIISNALKYTAPGGMISVRIVQKAVKPNGYATYEFHVKDNGSGMSEEFIETIFDPFTRAENSTVSGIQGTGLGMAITKNIVDMMGGTISVESRLHEGSEFVVALDFKLLSEHKPIEKIPKLDGLRSLVVDDDMNACQSVSDMLRAVGMRAEWCTFGKEAVVRTQEAIRIGDRFTVYVIDWAMPDMNGIETTRRIRQAVGDDCPIIIMTAYDYKDIEEEAYAAGVTRFVSKPLFPSDLRKALMDACEGKVATEEVSESEFSFVGKRILLAEDNELNREIATEILDAVGFVIESAANGQICCDMLSASEPGYYDVILMDIQMPILDGYGATKAIRQLDNKELASIPIIAMTANAFQEDRQQALDVGMNEHITKPIDIGELFRTLKDVFEAK